MLTRTLGPDDACVVINPVWAPHCPIDGYLVAIKTGFVSEFEVTEDTHAWDTAIHMLLLAFQANGFALDKCSGISTRLCTHGPKCHVHFDIVFWTMAQTTAAMLAFMLSDTGQVHDVKKGTSYCVRPDEDEDASPYDTGFDA